MEGELRNETILVVEDAESIRRMVCLMLSQSGYHCLEAGDGAEALEILENCDHAVNLVLTDMLMPNMTGTELVHRLARAWPGVRIILMSGYSDDPVVRVIERSRSIFLAKPFTAGALMEKVREVLDRPWTGMAEVSISGSSSA